MRGLLAHCWALTVVLLMGATLWWSGEARPLESDQLDGDPLSIPAGGDTLDTSAASRPRFPPLRLFDMGHDSRFTPRDARSDDTPRDARSGDTPRDARSGDTPRDARSGDTPRDARSGDTPRDARSYQTADDDVKNDNWLEAVEHRNTQVNFDSDNTPSGVDDSEMLEYIDYDHTTLDGVGSYATLDDVDRHTTLDDVGRSPTLDDVGSSPTLDDERTRTTLYDVEIYATLDDVGIHTTLDDTTLDEVDSRTTLDDIDSHPMLDDIRHRITLTGVDSHRTTLDDVNSHRTTLDDVDNDRTTLDDVDNHRTTLDDVDSHRTTLDDVDNHRTTLDDVDNHRTTLDDVDNHRTTLDEVESHRTTLDEVESHRTTLDEVESHRTTLDEVESHRTTLDDVESARGEGAGSAVRRVSRKRLKHARVGAVMQDMLQKLGYSEVPDVSNVTVDVEEMRRMLRLYRQSVQEIEGHVHALFDEEQFFAKQFHKVTDTGSIPPGTPASLWAGSALAARLYFPLHIPLPDDPKRDLHVDTATLQLHVAAARRPTHLRHPHDVDRTVRVEVYQLLRPVSADTPAPPRRLLDSVPVPLAAWRHSQRGDHPPGRLELDVSRAVQDWLLDPLTNFGLELACDNGQSIRDLVSVTPQHGARHNQSHPHPAAGGSHPGGVDGVGGGEDDDPLTPALSVLTQERSIIGRQKRSGQREDCTHGDGENRCCRYPLNISFRDIGWDNWIIAPEGYQAYYCDGSCPHRFKSANNFARVKSLLSLYNPAAAPAPCCTATKLRPLSILHYDVRGHMAISLYQDMVVEQCRCA